MAVTQTPFSAHERNAAGQYRASRKRDRAEQFTQDTEGRGYPIGQGQG